MRIPNVVSGVLAMTVLLLIAAACLQEVDPGKAAPRGHEDTVLPRVVGGTSVAVLPQQQAAAPTRARAPLPGCRSIEERLASIVKAAPDATVFQRLPAALADDYARSFNAIHGTSILADDVAVVTSSLWGSRGIVLFERHGCETGTEQTEINPPGMG